MGPHKSSSPSWKAFKAYQKEQWLINALCWSAYPKIREKFAKSGFTWVLGSRKPLNVAELQHAVAISAGQSTWVDLVNSLGFNFETQFGQTFGYMLRVDLDDDVRFAHATAKELLTSSAETLSPLNSAVLSNLVIRLTRN